LCEPSPKQPPSKVPVIGTNRITHYFFHPECINEQQKTILAQLPKRRCGRLRAASTEDAVGWGLHFKENWHWFSIYLVVVLLMAAGLAFGIAWSLIKNDVQGGLAISATWMTIASLLLGYLALRARH
jgi:hypothetical protein